MLNPTSPTNPSGLPPHLLADPTDLEASAHALSAVLHRQKAVRFNDPSATALDMARPAPKPRPVVSPKDQASLMHMLMPGDLPPDGLSASEVCRTLDAWMAPLSKDQQRQVLNNLVNPARPHGVGAGIPRDLFGGHLGPAGLWLLSSCTNAGVPISENVLPISALNMIGITRLPQPLKAPASTMFMVLLTNIVTSWTDRQWSRSGNQIWHMLSGANMLHPESNTANHWGPLMEGLAVHISQRAFYKTTQDVFKHIPDSCQFAWRAWRLKNPKKALWIGWELQETTAEHQRKTLPDVLRASRKTAAINPMPETVRNQITTGLDKWMSESQPVADLMLQDPSWCAITLSSLSSPPLDLWMDCLARASWPESAKIKAWPSATILMDALTDPTRNRDNLQNPLHAISLWVRQAPPGVFDDQAKSLVRRLQSCLLEQIPSACSTALPTPTPSSALMFDQALSMAQWARKEPELQALWLSLSPRYIVDEDFVSGVLIPKRPMMERYRRIVEVFSDTSPKLRGTIALAADLMGWPKPWRRSPKVTLNLSTRARGALAIHHADHLAQWDAAVSSMVLGRVLRKKSEGAEAQPATKFKM